MGRGVNRVVMAVHDMTAGKELFGALLDADFVDVPEAETTPYGVRVAMDFDAGIELVAPLAGVESHIRTILERQGEGLVGVVFSVADADAAVARAEPLGVSVYHTLDYDQATIDRNLGGRFATYKEHFVASTAGFHGSVVVGEFAGPDGH